MSSLFKGLFGGKSDAVEQAELSREQQRVANTRQLAELNRGEGATGLKRAAPRGRRLFADAGASGLKGTLA